MIVAKGRDAPSPRVAASEVRALFQTLAVTGAVMAAGPSSQAATDPGPGQYERARARLEHTRQKLTRSYQRAHSRAERRSILRQAEKSLLDALTQEILPAWYGTPWEFSGTTSKPRQGAIACGTFVGTVLAHAGFDLNRIAMGRLASEHIALSLTSEKNLRRYRNRPVREVEADVRAWGPGLYMVGLDRHAGLLHVDATGQVRFIHSSYYGPMSVLSEPVTGDNPFADSKYRVLAKLFDETMMIRWLRGKRFHARKVRRTRG